MFDAVVEIAVVVLIIFGIGFYAGMWAEFYRNKFFNEGD